MIMDVTATSVVAGTTEVAAEEITVVVEEGGNVVNEVISEVDVTTLATPLVVVVRLMTLVSVVGRVAPAELMRDVIDSGITMLVSEKQVCGGCDVNDEINYSVCNCRGLILLTC